MTAIRLSSKWDEGDKILDLFDQSPKDDDIAYSWGLNTHELPTLIFDLGYLKRAWDSFQKVGSYYQVGWNQLGWLPPDTCPADRFESLGMPIQPLKGGDRNVLLCGQVPCDKQHNLGEDELEDWLWAQARQFTKGEDIRYRPHPQWGKPTRTKEEDLAWADIVVSYNSTIGIEAMLMGLKTVQSEAAFYNNVVDRESFFHRLAYSQWTEDEIRDGRMWEFMKQSKPQS